LSRLILYLFGSPRIHMDEQPVVVDTRKATALLAYLAVTGKTHQRDALAALLWPDYDQTSARAALRRTLSTLHHALDGDHLEISRETIALDLGGEHWVDALEFHRLLAQASAPANAAHGHTANEICPECIRALEAATQLYQAPFMAGFSLRDSDSFDEWQFFQEETMRRELSGALEKLAFALQASQRTEEAIEAARRWLALDQLQEEAHRQLILLYYRSGQHSAALRQYQQCARVLNDELGVSPLEETQKLYQAVLNHTPLPETSTRLRFVPKGSVPTIKSTVIPDLGNEPGNKPLPRRLVGRAAELQRALQVFRPLTTAQPAAQGTLIALVGEAGIGKTRLAEELQEHAREQGMRIALARCYPGESSLAYAPLIHALGLLLDQPDAAGRIRHLAPATLAEAARLFPQIHSLYPGLPAATAAGESVQSQFFEAVRQVLLALLSGASPGMLFLDDLHWVDSASLRLITFLTHRLRETPLILLATWRTENGETVQALEHLAGETTRSGTAEKIELKRLNPQEVIELVKTYPGSLSAQSEQLGKRLYQESEGLPFIAVEYLAAFSAQKTAPAPAEWETPASVRDLLRSRLAGLESTARQLLSTAAVIGRSFDYNVLREASGRSENETVDGLDCLLETGLIAEQSAQEENPAPTNTPRYDFTHEKLREFVYHEETSQARRQLLHRRVAEVLTRPMVNRAEIAGQAAYHFEQARMPEQAAEYHRLAGEHSRQLFANVEALMHFQSALAMQHPEQAGIYEAIGDLHTLRGEYNAALACYRSAITHCHAANLASLEHKIGNLHQRLGDWEQADTHYQASLAAAGSSGEDVLLKVHLYADLSLSAYSQGTLECAQELAEQALSLAEAASDPYARAQANNMLGILARARGETGTAIAHLEASLADAKTLYDPLAEIAALNNLALVYREQPETSPGPAQTLSLERAMQLTQQALDLCQKRGDRHHQAALHNNLADLLHKLGREEEAMAQLKQAVIIFAEINATIEIESGASSPLVTEFPAEIWKLTEW
jgi:DNA-binding SARP family transcriptional activator